MNDTTRRLLATCMTISAGSTSAQEFTEGWYVAPMATYLSPDSGRCEVDSGYGATAALGHRGESASVEVWAQFLELPFGPCAYTVPAPTQVDPDARATVTERGNVELNGGGIALLVGPFSKQNVLTRLYGLVGIGVMQRGNHPQYPDDEATIVGDIGAGYLQPFTLWNREFLVRLEGRYRYDVQSPPHPDEQDPAPPHAYNDVVVNLGLQVPLSAPARPVAAPEPVAVVPAVAGDSDNDGVNDDRDQCPGTPSGSYVSNVGCPAALTAPDGAPEFDDGPVLETAKAGDTIVLKGVTFESGKARLRADSETILDGVAETLQRRPDLRVEIGGHTDSRGAEAYNQSLSQQRADAVLAYLVGRGIDAGRLSALGYGESRPVATNETDEGRERNRRVELKVQSITGEGS